MQPSERMWRLRQMLIQVAPESRLDKLVESLESGSGSADGIVEALDAGLPDGNDESFALETLDVLVRNGIDSPLDETQQESLEAIVLPRLRPVINIIDDTFGKLPSPWKHLGMGPVRSRIEDVIPSIGRIETPHQFSLPFAGTGFVVGSDLIMTNRHVAEIFATGLGQRNLEFRPGQTAALDLKQEVVPTEPELLTVQRIVMIHPYWDMALLQVSGLPAGHPVLKISVANPSDLSDRDIVVIGYPAQDNRNDLNLQNRIFRGVYNVKRLQPGKLKDRGSIRSYGNNVSAVTHDSSTLGGNSGSAVIDVSTGEVVGLHFSGVYLKANFAVPTFDLAQDSQVVDAGVNFAGSLDPRSDFYVPVWTAASSNELAAADGPGIQGAN